MSDKRRASTRAAIVGCLLLAAGTVYAVAGPVGRNPGWSEHEYAAWGLVASGVVVLLLVALPARLVERRHRPTLE